MRSACWCQQKRKRLYKECIRTKHTASFDRSERRFKRITVVAGNFKIITHSDFGPLSRLTVCDF